MAWGGADPSEAPPAAALGWSHESSQGLWQMSSGPRHWTDAASDHEAQCSRPEDTRAEGPSGGGVSTGVSFMAWTLRPSTAHPQRPRPGCMPGGASPGVRRPGLRAGLRGLAGRGGGNVSPAGRSTVVQVEILSAGFSLSQGVPARVPLVFRAGQAPGPV